MLGANMIGLLTYDTPFYSINRNFIAEKAWSGVDHMNRGIGDLWNAGAAICTAVTATKTMQRMSHLGAEAGKKWGIVAGIVSVTALGAAAFATRQKISSNITNAYQELTFVSDLTDIHGLNERYLSSLFFFCVHSIVLYSF